VPIAVVGAGPSAVYATQELLRKTAESIDIFERLPTPFGLLRYGVAPDHPAIKSLVGPFVQVLSDERVQFVGNVEVGRDVSVTELRAIYSAVIFATGAPESRRLGLPGETLSGSMSAAEFVGWYNGHPEAPLVPGGSTAAAVIGLGNVALDVARILARPARDLAQTDVPEHVLSALRCSRIRDVHIVGRAGFEGVKFTAKELREIGSIEDLDVVVHGDIPSESAISLRAAPPNLVRSLDILRSWSGRPRTGAPRAIHVHVGMEPVDIVGDEQVVRVRFRANGRGSGGSSRLELAAGLVVSCLGYRSAPIMELPFDRATGVVPNVRGRIVRGGAASPTEFVVGWAKRGATGVIGSNRADAIETVAELLARQPPVDRPTRPMDIIMHLLDDRSARSVSWAGWQGIQAVEARLGASVGRPTAKIADRHALLLAAGCPSCTGAGDPRGPDEGGRQ
jgi:ferredoxin--NADP+ reductase